MGFLTLEKKCRRKLKFASKLGAKFQWSLAPSLLHPRGCFHHNLQWRSCNRGSRGPLTKTQGKRDARGARYQTSSAPTSCSFSFLYQQLGCRNSIGNFRIILLQPTKKPLHKFFELGCQDIGRFTVIKSLANTSWLDSCLL